MPNLRAHLAICSCLALFGGCAGPSAIETVSPPGEEAGETQSNDPEPPLGVVDPAETCGDRCDPGCGAPCADDTTEDCDETGAGCGDTPEDCDETGAGCGDTPENGGGDVPDPQPCVEDAGPEGGEAIDWGAARAQATPKTGCEAVASADAFNACAADAQPGELIVIADGSYDGWRLAVPSDGAIYTAETPGGVTFTGTHELGLLVTGDDNIIGGFRFEACGDNFVVFNGGSGNRFTDNRFDGCGQNSGWRILGIRDAANGNRFDHNHFLNATAKNATVDQPRDGETHFATSVGNRFDHNLFEGTGKKQPALQIAQYAAPEHYNPNPTNTIVDHNVFRSNTGQSVNSKSSEKLRAAWYRPTS